ncbi:MAG: TetR/AcrR family transcriptional regulator [Kocuria sp.]|nr:TetR/AcrR family transcriptional regulator [Kocuria sp.]
MKTPHQEQAIADAAIRVIVHQGFDVVSIRKVAAEAKVALGTVQYFMGTKEGLLIKVLRRSVARQSDRIEQLQFSPSMKPVDRLSRSLLELLPTGEVQREDAALWVILGAAASTRPLLAQHYDQALTLFRESLIHAIGRFLEAQGKSNSAEEVKQTARLITALVNGITLDNLNSPYSTQLVETIHRDLLAGLSRITGA